MTSDYIIGIDLGTTYSCVAVWKNGHVEIIPNDMGTNTTPSCVSFTENERFIGQLAKENSLRNPKNTIFDIKRLIGRHMDDPIVQNDAKNWPFTITENQSHQPVITATYKGKEQSFHPEEISAMILEKLKSYAEDYLSQRINKVVITVPAYFNDSQRQATKDAAQIAGLQCVRMINEPTAAALAYGLDKKCQQEEKVLIFDLGGGTLDVSLLAIENGTFEVLATSGDSHLGGEDFDNRILTHICGEFNRQHANTTLNAPPIETNLKAMRKLKSICEKAKITLSSAVKTVIEIDSLHNGFDFSLIITRSRFEELCLDLFKKCLIPIHRVLKDTKIKKETIHEIVLVGGSTRIPYIQHQLKEFFNGKELNKSVHPDEAVAYGAAIQGSILSRIPDQKTSDIVLLDVIPLSLGLETAGGVMSFIIERNTPIPCMRKDRFTTYTDNQKAVTITIFEGERPMTKYNNKLGQFDLVDLAPAAKGVPQIEVAFDIDDNGILTVTATDINSSSHNQIKIIKDKGLLNDKEITQMIIEAEKYRQDDLLMKTLAELRNKAESLIYQTKNYLIDEQFEKEISVEEKNALVATMNTLRKWLDEHLNPTLSEYEENITHLEQLRNIILTRIYAEIPKL
jgi:L1 cell adhesion molecule like protein